MPRKADVDWSAVATAAPRSIIRRRDLLALGVPNGTIAHRTRPGGPWVVVVLGVIALVRGVLTVEQRLEAALLFAGPGAMLTGAVACRLHGLENVPDGGPVDVLLDHARRRASRSFVRIERTRRLPTARTRCGFPVAPVARAVVDAARRMTRLDVVRALVAEAVQTRRTTPEALREELDASTPRGTTLLRIAVEEIEAGVRSAAEAWAREVAQEMRTEGFPEIRFNVRVHTLAGEHIITPDGWVDDVAMAWEIQSRQYHLLPEHQEKALIHMEMLSEHQIVVAESLPKHLKTRREQVKAHLWARYRLAASRPRPPVRAY